MNHIFLQNGLLACGGYDGGYTCVKFVDGAWETTHNLKYYRSGHTSWDSPDGILLVGGGSSSLTTELLNDDGGSTESFSLKFDRSRYI